MWMQKMRRLVKRIEGSAATILFYSFIPLDGIGRETPKVNLKVARAQFIRWIFQCLLGAISAAGPWKM